MWCQRIRIKERRRQDRAQNTYGVSIESFYSNTALSENLLTINWIMYGEKSGIRREVSTV